MARTLEPVTLSGTHVRLEPLAQSHLDGIMRAGDDDATEGHGTHA